MLSNTEYFAPLYVIGTVPVAEKLLRPMGLTWMFKVSSSGVLRRHDCREGKNQLVSMMRIQVGGVEC